MTTTWPRALVFDLDGTLADSFSAIQVALDEVLRERGFAGRDLDWVKARVGRGSRALVRDAVGDDEFRVDEVLDAYLGRYSEIFLDVTPPVEGAREVLSLVWDQTAGRVAVVSNKMATLSLRWLEYYGLMPFVVSVSGPDTSSVLKPDTGSVTPVLAEMGVGAGEALMIGDMTVDVLTGQNAGIPVVVVRRFAADPQSDTVGARGVIDDLRELPGWLVRNGDGWS